MQPIYIRIGSQDQRHKLSKYRNGDLNATLFAKRVLYFFLKKEIFKHSIDCMSTNLYVPDSLCPHRLCFMTFQTDSVNVEACILKEENYIRTLQLDRLN